MSRHKTSDSSSSPLFVSPFAALDIPFTSEELASYESEKSLKEQEVFPGGMVKVRLEKKGRGGKMVTVFYDFEKEQGDAIELILMELKRKLGTGGVVVEGCLEFQGDQRVKSVEWLKLKGYKVKGEIK